jgi:hypothetical protein
MNFKEIFKKVYHDKVLTRMLFKRQRRVNRWGQIRGTSTKKVSIADWQEKAKRPGQARGVWTKTILVTLHSI